MIFETRESNDVPITYSTVKHDSLGELVYVMSIRVGLILLLKQVGSLTEFSSQNASTAFILYIWIFLAWVDHSKLHELITHLSKVLSRTVLSRIPKFYLKMIVGTVFTFIAKYSRFRASLICSHHEHLCLYGVYSHYIWTHLQLFSTSHRRMTPSSTVLPSPCRYLFNRRARTGMDGITSHAFTRTHAVPHGGVLLIVSG